MTCYFDSYYVIYHIKELSQIQDKIMYDLIDCGLIDALIKNVPIQGNSYFETAVDLYGFLVEKEIRQAIDSLGEFVLCLNFEVFNKNQLPSINFLNKVLPYEIEDLVQNHFFDIFIPQILGFHPNELSISFKVLENASSIGYAKYLFDNNILSIIQELFNMNEDFSEPNPIISSFNIISNIIHIDIDHAFCILSSPLINVILYNFKEGQYEERIASTILITSFIPYCQNSDFSYFISNNLILDSFLEMLQTDFNSSYFYILQSISLLYNYYKQNALIYPLSEYFSNIYNSTQFNEVINNLKENEYVNCTLPLSSLLISLDICT